jgi:hypothetical protein
MQINLNSFDFKYKGKSYDFNQSLDCIYNDQENNPDLLL